MRRKGSPPGTHALPHHRHAQHPRVQAGVVVVDHELWARHSSRPRTSSLYGLSLGIYTIHHQHLPP